MIKAGESSRLLCRPWQQDLERPNFSGNLLDAKEFTCCEHAWEIAMKPDRDPRPGLPSAQERSRTTEPLQRKPKPRLVDLESIRRVVPNHDDPDE